VNQSSASALARAFGLLFAARYPSRQMRVIDVSHGSDERSMLADNTSAFNVNCPPGCHDGAPNARIWTARALIGTEPTAMH
jgi:hypothetical protein